MTSKPCPFGPQSCPPPPVVAVAESVPEGMDPASWIAGHTAGQILANSRYLPILHGIAARQAKQAKQNADRQIAALNAAKRAL